jgi:hypothetical protein
VLANFANLFFPVFKDTGYVWRQAVVASLAAFGLLLYVWYVMHRWGQWTIRLRVASSIGSTIIGMGVFLLLMVSIQRSLSWDHVRKLLELARIAIHALLSVGIGVAFFRGAQWSWQEKKLGGLATGLILASSAVAFTYFRLRNLNLGLMGWILLLVLAVQRLDRKRWQHRLRLAILYLALMAVLINGVLLITNLPPNSLRPENFDDSSYLCKERIPADLAIDVARKYGIDIESLHRCRLQSY